MTDTAISERSTTDGRGRLFDLVDRAYVINLPSRPDRRQEITLELESMFGTAAVAEKAEFVDGLRPDDAGPFVSIGTHGCFLSHLAVLRAAHAAGHRRIVVLEDDTEFTAHAAWQLPELVERLAAQRWDLVNLGYKDDDFSVNPTAFQLSVMPHRDAERRRSVDSGARPGPPPRLARMRGGLLGNHFYLVDGLVLGELIEHLQACLTGVIGDDLHGPMAVDGAFNTFEWTHEIVRLVALPSQAGQRSSRSDITPRRLDRLAALAPVLSHARALRRRIA